MSTYRNSGSSNNKTNNTMMGLAVGGVAHNVPRLHITPNFEQCKACIWDSTFDIGPLLSNEEQSFFDVASIEVYAVTTTKSCANDNNDTNKNSDDDNNYNEIYEEGKRRGECYVSMMEHVRRRSAKVDRTQFVDHFTSGVFPNSPLFQHRVETCGRASDFVVSAASDVKS
jgi:TLD